MTRHCRSNIHEEPVAAVVVGVFDCSAMNGKPPEPGSAYCLRCGVALAEAGWFTPTDGTTLPAIDSYLAFEEGKEYGVMHSAHSERTGHDLVDGPYDRQTAQALRETLAMSGLQAVLAVRTEEGWVDIYGRPADEVMSAFVADWHAPAAHGEPLPRLDAPTPAGEDTP